jgi:hypothetical protein
MKIDILHKDDYEWLLQKDHEIYPTDKPVTKSIIAQWFVHNPEFGIIFKNNHKITGTNITIPLNREGWEGLINGRVLESECDQRYIFDNNRNSEIGLHIYHIRKTVSIKEFYIYSLVALNEIVQNLRKENENLKVMGLSAFCVTRMSIGLFFNKLNCMERAFISSEHILGKNNRLEIFKTNNQEELKRKLSNGYTYVNRCKMLLTYPGNVSLVWKYITSE